MPIPLVLGVVMPPLLPRDLVSSTFVPYLLIFVLIPIPIFYVGLIPLRASLSSNRLPPDVVESCCMPLEMDLFREPTPGAWF